MVSRVMPTSGIHTPVRNSNIVTRNFCRVTLPALGPAEQMSRFARRALCPLAIQTDGYLVHVLTQAIDVGYVDTCHSACPRIKGRAVLRKPTVNYVCSAQNPG
jgi:hypothetical protein